MKQFVDPMAKGHRCFRTDDIKGLMRRRDGLGIRNSGYGKWAIAGWQGRRRWRVDAGGTQPADASPAM